MQCMASLLGRDMPALMPATVLCGRSNLVSWHAVAIHANPHRLRKDKGKPNSTTVMRNPVQLSTLYWKAVNAVCRRVGREEQRCEFTIRILQGADRVGSSTRVGGRVVCIRS